MRATQFVQFSLRDIDPKLPHYPILVEVTLFDEKQRVIVRDAPMGRVIADHYIEVSYIADASIIAAAQSLSQMVATASSFDHAATAIVSLARKIEEQRRAQKQ